MLPNYKITIGPKNYAHREGCALCRITGYGQVEKAVTEGVYIRTSQTKKLTTVQHKYYKLTERLERKKLRIICDSVCCRVYDTLVQRKHKKCMLTSVKGRKKIIFEIWNSWILSIPQYLACANTYRRRTNIPWTESLWYWPPDPLRSLSFNHFLSNKNVALCNCDGNSYWNKLFKKTERTNK